MAEYAGRAGWASHERGTISGGSPETHSEESAAGASPARRVCESVPRRRRDTMRRIIALGWATALAVAVGSAGLRAEDKPPEGKAAEAAADKDKAKDARGPGAEGKK